MKARQEPAVWLIAITFFLAPLIGGQIVLDSVPITDALLPTLTGGPETPLLTQALLTLPLASALILLLSRRVIQVPQARFAASISLFFGLVVASSFMSAFRFASLAASAQWLAYAVGLFTVVAGAGRRQGPVILMSALFAGTALLALRGLMEYGEMKATDPTWRIFAGWINPNATAAMLLLGFFVGLGVMLTRPRLEALVAGLGCGAIGIAILLTQSKGALLVLAIVSVLFFLLTFTVGKGQVQKAALGRLAATFVALGILGGVILFGPKAAPTPPPASGQTAPAATGTTVAPAALARLSQSDSTREQSAGFRKLLWLGSVDMMKANPAGFGIGTYRFESGRSGRHTQTVFTHNSFLQLGTEASVLAPLLLIGGGLFWLGLVSRGWKTHQPENRLRIIAVVTAVLAIVFHSFVDSDLYYFGVGISFFSLIGLGLLLSGDAVSPEALPVLPRRVASLAGFAVVLGLMYTGVIEMDKGMARAAVQQRDINGSRAILASAAGMAPLDGDVWFQTALVSATPSERTRAAELASQLSPTTRNLRLLARTQADAGNITGGISTLRSALVRDPNNLLTLALMVELQDQMGDTREADVTRRRLINVEKSTYLSIRSLAELVPTETLMARIQLASHITDTKERIELLKGAVDGFNEYYRLTVPMVKQMATGNPPADYAGETVEKAKDKLLKAAQAATSLATLYRAAGDEGSAADAELLATTFGGAFDK